MADYRVLVTGSRTWTDATFIGDVLHEVLAPRSTGFTLVHGGALRGADRFADEWASDAAYRGEPVTVETHRADWRTGRSAGLARNAEMVAAGADLCLCFLRDCDKPKCAWAGPHGSHGATHCAKLARVAGIETRIYRWEEIHG